MHASRKVAASALALSLVVAGCSGDPGPRTGEGIAFGALTGGLLGALTGRPGNAVAGAVVGGLVGGMIGNALDEEDRRMAYAAELEALESEGPGVPHSWRGRRGYGTIVVGPPYAYASYQRCREYTHTIYIDGRPQTARGIACRNPDGSWTPLS
jgi:surface antigen